MERKTVQIITIPLFKEGYKKGDLCKRIKSSDYYTEEKIGRLCIAVKDFSNINEEWQVQQLLVISDDEIKEGDCAYYNTGNIQPCNSELWGKKDAARCELDRKAYGDCKKIIASYPQLEGTLSISKETIEEWINTGTPKEGSVETVIDCQGYYGYGNRGCHSPCKCPLKYKVKEYPFSGDAYPKDNLLLEFSKKIIDTLPYPELVKEISEYHKNVKIVKEKPSIPTDKEIRIKAKNEYNKLISEYVVLDWYTFKRAYDVAYKQAIKDLNHE
jgi:hypothetical protein